MRRSSLIKLKQNNDITRSRKIKDMTEIITDYFSTHIHSEYSFRYTDIIIDDIPVNISITEELDRSFFDKPDNINKYGTFRITKSVLEHNSRHHNMSNLQKELNAYNQLEPLYLIQESLQNKENSELEAKNLQIQIKEVINRVNDSEKIIHGCYGQPKMPCYLMMYHLHRGIGFGSNSISHEFFSQLISGSSTLSESQVVGLHQIQLLNVPPEPQNSSQQVFKYTLDVIIPADIRNKDQYVYRAKITSDKFTLISNGNCDNFTLATSIEFNVLEEVIDALDTAVNTFKFFDDMLLSPEDFKKATIERELFPLHEDFNCCICLIPTRSVTSCKHRICFKCRHTQVTQTNNGPKRLRCPVCRKKNELNCFYEDDCEENDHEEDGDDGDHGDHGDHGDDDD